VTWFFLLLGTLCLALAAHPFVTYPLSLWLLKPSTPRRRPEQPAAAADLTFAICMCAYNEERVIEQKMANLLQLRAHEPGLKILVYVDAATDRTAEILRRYEDVIELHVARKRRGKTYGMNLLSARARADVLVFTDANVMLDLWCIDDLRAHFADPEVGCVCGSLTYINAHDSVTAASGSSYWRFEEALKRLESRSGSMMGADGSIFAVRRELRSVPPDHIIDDMYVSLMVLVAGFRVIQVPDAKAYERSVSSAAEEFGRKVRIACQAFNVHRLLWPQLRRLDALTCYKYVSHKLLRWLCIYFLAAAALFFLIALASAGRPGWAVAAVAIAAIGAVLGARWSIKPFAQIVDLLTALAGAGLGVWRSLRGERFQTWQPASSIRKAGGAPS
jgi:cellulose synthase/poly-beta-1,6-N-acetylglucosamine synthase-like glycosyltransferase